MLEISGMRLTQHLWTLSLWLYILCLSQQLGSEVERREGKQVNYTQDSSFFSKKRRRATLGISGTHCIYLYA